MYNSFLFRYRNKFFISYSRDLEPCYDLIESYQSIVERCVDPGKYYLSIVKRRKDPD